MVLFVSVFTKVFNYFFLKNLLDIEFKRHENKLSFKIVLIYIRGRVDKTFRDTIFFL